MTYVPDATARVIHDIKHYVQKLKEHEAQRLSFNERMAYWKKYHEDLEKSE
tara:strand:- start:8981 stop:9133 length:153 start_codon:yes stop_codon:yes gene_type:complete